MLTVRGGGVLCFLWSLWSSQSARQTCPFGSLCLWTAVKTHHSDNCPQHRSHLGIQRLRVSVEQCRSQISHFQICWCKSCWYMHISTIVFASVSLFTLDLRQFALLAVRCILNQNTLTVVEINYFTMKLYNLPLAPWYGYIWCSGFNWGHYGESSICLSGQREDVLHQGKHEHDKTDHLT